MKVYHNGAAMTSSVIDAMLILTRMTEYTKLLTMPLLLPMRLQLKGNNCNIDRLDIVSIIVIF